MRRWRRLLRLAARRCTRVPTSATTQETRGQETRGQVSHFPFHFSFSFSYFFTTRLTVELDYCKVGDLTPRPIGIVTDIDTVQDLARAEALLAAR